MELLTHITPLFLGLAIGGTAIGIVFGAIPGMTATMALAVCLPLTYALGLENGLALLLGLYVGGISGGLVPAILLNIPGTPSSIATTFDGHPMARAGHGAFALRLGISASLFGGLFSLLVLWLFAPTLADFAIRFSTVEKFLVIVLALTVMAALGGSLLVGVFSGFLGILLSLVGAYDTDIGGNGELRLVPEALEYHLESGFSLLPVLIGIFGVAAILEEAERGVPANASAAGEDDDPDGPGAGDAAAPGAAGSAAARRPSGDGAVTDAPAGGERPTPSGTPRLLSYLPRQIVNLTRSAGIGTFIGILPGVGGSAASIFSYSQARNFSRSPGKFGRGEPAGLVASESANNGLTGGALVPLLSLGIPGDATTAILIGAFTLQGIQVGPLFIGENPQTWNLMIVAMLVANLAMFVLMMLTIRHLARIVHVPKQYLLPVILMMCVVGAYAINYGIMFDVWTLLIFGLFGYVAPKIGLAVPPFIIGFILGPSAEIYFVKSLESFGTLEIFFTKSWIALLLWALIAASVAFSVIMSRRGAPADGTGPQPA